MEWDDLQKAKISKMEWDNIEKQLANQCLCGYDGDTTPCGEQSNGKRCPKCLALLCDKCFITFNKPNSNAYCFKCNYKK
jgi:hypothetical protein